MFTVNTLMQIYIVNIKFKCSRFGNTFCIKGINNMNYEITEITDYADAEFQSAFTSYFTELGIEIRKNTDLWNVMKDTKNMHCYVIRNPKIILGFIMFQREFLNSDTGFFLESVGYIRELYVRREFRKSGLGSLLLNTAENFFRENSVYKLILTYENNAVDFYKKLGFKEDKSYKAKNGHNIMIKII